MRTYLFLFFMIAFASCQEKAKNEEVNNETTSKNEYQDNSGNKYPEDFTKVLDAHGGMENWNKEKTLRFTIPKPEGNEEHITDLSSRMDKTITPDYEMGYDGQDAWVMNINKDLKGKASFMHNLMFYFYAMPFVLADNGAQYSKAEDLIVDGKTFPGIKVTFNKGVGVSSDDEYWLHYDPDTYHMAWLGYTATFGSSDKQIQPHWISYDKWTDVNDLVLPKSIAWHEVDSGMVKGEQNRVEFNQISLWEKSNPKSFYEAPAGAKIVSTDK